MRELISSVVEVAGMVAVVAGVALAFGAPVGLIVGGVFAIVVGLQAAP